MLYPPFLFLKRRLESIRGTLISFLLSMTRQLIKILRRIAGVMIRELRNVISSRLTSVYY